MALAPRPPRRLLGGLAAALLALGAVPAVGAPLGLPEVPIPASNPQSEAKIALGKKLFEDVRFSSTGKVSCATCHAAATGFTDSPKVVSEGINGLKGTRNAPTVINAAYFTSMFWDGRSPDLEDQALHPPVNPVEGGLADHEPILAIVRKDPAYRKAFADVFGVKPDAITMREVTMAIASFERTVVAGNSPFDRWFYGGEEAALTDQQKRGYELYIGKARCQACHVIEETQALFSDNRFHNIGVGVNRIQGDIPELAGKFLAARATRAEVDKQVLTDARTSELGRFVVTNSFDGLGAFKTATLRNTAVTAPYMHDGSIATLRKVIEHYNNGGVTNPGDPVNDYLSGGIRPLDLTEAEIADLEAFMNALTSPEFAAQVPTPKSP